MQFLRSLIFQVWMYGLMGIVGIVLSPCALWSRAGAYFAIGIYLDLVFWGLRHLCGLTYEIRGTPPTGDVLVASKHQSFLDILIALRALPRAQFVMKRSLVWAPFLGWYALRIGASPVTRGRGAESISEMMEGVRRARREPGQLVIFPQGTRVAPGGKAVYRAGVLALCQGFDLACVPAAVNTGLFWPRYGIVRRPGVAVMEFLEPMPPGMAGRDFLSLLETRIETASDRLMAEAGGPPSQGSARAKVSASTAPPGRR